MREAAVLTAQMTLSLDSSLFQSASDSSLKLRFLKMIFSDGSLRPSICQQGKEYASVEPEQGAHTSPTLHPVS